jgi:hypothetical protein
LRNDTPVVSLPFDRWRFFRPIHPRTCEAESQMQFTAIPTQNTLRRPSHRPALAAQTSLCLRLYSRGGQRNASQASTRWGVRVHPSPALLNPVCPMRPHVRRMAA